MPKSTIDLYTVGGTSTLAYSQLDFYDDKPKRTGTGMHFCSYYGLRLYLITGKKEGRFLQGATQYVGDDLKYEYVPDLIQQMEDALRLNLSKSPLLVAMLKKTKPEFIWSQMGIRDCEKEWVEVVRRVVATL